MHTSRKESRKKNCSEPGLQQKCFLETGKEIKIKKKKKNVQVYFNIFSNIYWKKFTRKILYKIVSWTTAPHTDTLVEFYLIVS